MSSDTSSSGSNGTIIITAPKVIQREDFFIRAGILHPIIVGSIAVLTLFAYLRLGSNRSVAPITVFDWLINVALGSTLAGIVNGNSLVRGLLALATMLGFQFITSHLASNFSQHLSWFFHSPPLLVVFRGKMLTKVMQKHRISPCDINAALRQHAILNVSQVECGIIEANGSISIFTMQTLHETNVEPDALMVVPAYRALCEQAEKISHSDPMTIAKEKRESGPFGNEGSHDQNHVANNCC